MHASITPSHLASVLQKVSPKCLFISKHLFGRFMNAIKQMNHNDNNDGDDNNETNNVNIGSLKLIVLFDDLEDSYTHHDDYDYTWSSNEKYPKCVSDITIPFDHFKKLGRSIHDSTNGNNVLTRIQSIYTAFTRSVRWLNSYEDVVFPVRKGTTKHNDIVLLLPTSGTSGVPKLTIVNQSMLMHQVSVPKRATFLVMYSFEPLKQSIDVLCKGGRIGVYSGHISNILQDCALLRPTVLGATPSLWNSLYIDYQNELSTLKNERFSDIETTGLSEEQKKQQRNNLEKRLRMELSEEWKKRALLGNRCRMAIVGGAKASEEVKEFIFNALNCFVIDGYGTTETGGLSGNSQQHSGIKLQLVDCPELGYMTNDKPNPRGEIIAYTSRLTPGYYNDEEANKEKFVTISGIKYFRTGDIGVLINGNITVIDRCSSVFKLSQGVFVAPTPLENLYLNSEYISNVFIYGKNEFFSVVAVVVPSLRLLDEVKTIHGIAGDHSDITIESLCDTNNNQHHHVAQEILIKDIRAIATSNNLKSYEVPVKLHLEHEDFSVANGLLSSIGKICRPALIRKYKPIFDKYVFDKQSVDDEQQCGGSMSTTNRVSVPGLSSVLLDILYENIPHIESLLLSPDDDSLVTLGADSLTLARISQNIKRRLGQDIPPSQLAKFKSLVELQSSIYGVSLEELEESVDWSLEVSNQLNDINEYNSHSSSSVEDGGNNNKNIFLTGSTGFLGIFILDKILHDPLYESLNVYCLVRAESVGNGIRKIKDSLKYYGLCRGDGDGDGDDDNYPLHRIKVVIGELSLQNMGIEKAMYDELTSNIGIIIHNGATVNSVLSYRSLHLPNVVGTTQVIKLSLDVKRKYADIKFVHVSTIGFLSGSKITDEVDIPQPHAAFNHLSGYAKSKWVAEQVFQKSIASHGIRGLTCRPGMISGHRKLGSTNPHDSTTLLIAGLVKEKMYCITDDSPIMPFFPLVPVDWVSSTIVDLIQTLVNHTETTHQSININDNRNRNHNGDDDDDDDDDDNNVYHLVANNPVPFETMVQVLNCSGFKLNQLDTDQFVKRIQSIDDVRHPLNIFKRILSTPSTTRNSKPSLPSNDNTLRALSRLHSRTIDQEIDSIRVTPYDLEKCFKFLEIKGILHPQ
eukprot:TRINITY_DN1943_c0_g1_i2.p1 TRINITY_DN1943_c0_g1~~TRINITY_DN1943_c0_g1_i2.p1  ORF type:complete len:1136 (+),score=323.52 TRINITY_DN1943_c0_g1_i2:186-3593(+)